MSDSLWPHGLSMEFSRQEYWSGLPFPSPGNLPNPGTEPRSSALRADFFLPSEPSGKSWQQFIRRTHRTYWKVFIFWFITGKGSRWKLATGDFPGSLVVGNLPAKAGDTGSINPGPGVFQVLLCNHAIHHNYWTRVLGPMNNNYWSLCTLEPVLCNKRRLCTAKPVHHN